MAACLLLIQDEYADHVDGGGFTMPVIATTLSYANTFRQMFGLPQNETWADMAKNVLVSRDPESDITLEYTSMNGTTMVKQADVVLNTFPLQYTQDYSLRNALDDLDYVITFPFPISFFFILSLMNIL